MGYLKITGRWSGYEGQTNCDTSERRGKLKPMSHKEALKYIGTYKQTFSDGTYNIWEVSYTDSNELNNDGLGFYTEWVKSQGFPF